MILPLLFFTALSFEAVAATVLRRDHAVVASALALDALARLTDFFIGVYEGATRKKGEDE